MRTKIFKLFLITATSALLVIAATTIILAESNPLFEPNGCLSSYWEGCDSCPGCSPQAYGVADIPICYTGGTGADRCCMYSRQFRRCRDEDDDPWVYCVYRKYESGELGACDAPIGEYGHVCAIGLPGGG